MNAKSRRGAAGQQYAIVVGLTAVIGIASIATMGSSIKNLFGRTSNTISGVVNTTPAVAPVVYSPPVTGQPQYTNELPTNGTNGITGARYWAVTVTPGSPTTYKFDWPIVFIASGATTWVNGTAPTGWHSLHSGCGNVNGIAGCRSYCSAIGMAFSSVNTNCSTGPYPTTFPSPVGVHLYALNDGSGNPTGGWNYHSSASYTGTGNNMNFCVCSQ